MKKQFSKFKLMLLLLMSLALYACTFSRGDKPEEGGSAIELSEISDIHNKTSDTVTLAGIVKNHTEKIACFFVHQEMVAQEITEGLGEKADSGICTDLKLGKGVPVNFSLIDKASDYPHPPQEDVLILVKGIWKTERHADKGEIHTLYIINYEPFF